MQKGNIQIVKEEKSVSNVTQMEIDSDRKGYVCRKRGRYRVKGKRWRLTENKVDAEKKHTNSKRRDKRKERNKNGDRQ